MLFDDIWWFLRTDSLLTCFMRLQATKATESAISPRITWASRKNKLVKPGGHVMAEVSFNWFWFPRQKLHDFYKIWRSPRLWQLQPLQQSWAKLQLDTGEQNYVVVSCFFAFWEYPEPHKYLATPILTFTAHDSQRKGWHFIFQLFCCLSHSLVKSHLLVFSDPPNYILWSWRKNRILTPTAMVLGATVKFSMPFSVTKTLSYCWHRVSGASDRGSENLSGDRKWMHHLCIVKCYNLPITIVFSPRVIGVFDSLLCGGIKPSFVHFSLRMRLGHVRSLSLSVSRPSLAPEFLLQANTSEVAEVR